MEYFLMVIFCAYTIRMAGGDDSYIVLLPLGCEDRVLSEM